MSRIEKIAARAIDLAGAEWGASRDEILVRTRSSKRIAYARQVAMYLTKRVAQDASWSEIGRIFDRDRTTVRHAYQTVDGQFWNTETIRRLVVECTASAL